MTEPEQAGTGSLREHLGRLRAWALAEAKTNPGRAVLVAAGLGYTSGGGLASPLTSFILRAGQRAMLRMVAMTLVDFAANLASNVLSDDGVS